MIHHGDAITVLRDLARRGVTVHCIVTSPPYWSLRNYGVTPTIWGGDPDCVHEWESAGSKEGYTSKRKWQHNSNGRDETTPERTHRDPVTRKELPEAWDQIEQGKYCVFNCGAWLGCLGLEPTPDLYVNHIVQVFDAAWDVLRDDGTLWLNLGDCYAAASHGGGDSAKSGLQGSTEHQDASKGGSGNRIGCRSSFRRDRMPRGDVAHKAAPGLKPKDLVGIPWMVAFALRDRGWYLRMDNIWSKTNPMPESARDRSTKSHEYMFHLSKSEHYFYDADAIREGVTGNSHSRGKGVSPKSQPRGKVKANVSFHSAVRGVVGTRNRRSVWRLPTKRFKGAHFATFPPRLVEPCILAGTSAYGGCGICGTGFRRVVQLGAPLRDQQRAAGAGADGEYNGSATKTYDGTGAQDPSATKKRILEGMRERITVGWAPTCKCGGFAVRAVHSRRLERAWYRQRWQARIDARWAGLFGRQKPIAMDMFSGTATVGLVAAAHDRDFIGIELNPDYIVMSEARSSVTPAAVST